MRTGSPPAQCEYEADRQPCRGRPTSPLQQAQSATVGNVDAMVTTGQGSVARQTSEDALTVANKQKARLPGRGAASFIAIMSSFVVKGKTLSMALIPQWLYIRINF